MHLAENPQTYMDALSLRGQFTKSVTSVETFWINKEALGVHKANSMGSVYTLKDYIIGRMSEIGL